MQDKLIEKSTKTRHCPKCNGSDVILTYRYWNNDLNCRCRTCDYEWSEKPSDAVRAHDAGTTPTAAVNYAAIDRGWRMFCQSCGTDAPCPNCEVCGALLTMVQCNDTEAGTDEGLTDARWNALCRDISDRRGLKNGWWLIDDDVKQDIRAAWSRILYAPPASHAAESAAPDTLHFCAACWAGNHGSCSGDKCGCAHDSASVSTAQLDAEDQHRAAEPVEDVPAGYYSLEAVEKAIRWQMEIEGWGPSRALAQRIRARLASKAEPTLAEEVDAILGSTPCTCNAGSRKHAVEQIAALLKRRTKA